MNPFGFNGHWKIDPDNRQDRKNGEVVIRKMTPEEIEKYGPAVKTKSKQSEIAAVPSMVRKDVEMKKINQERLIEICKEYGFTSEAYKKAAAEFGVTYHSVSNYVSDKKLKSLIETEKTQKEEATDNQAPNDASVNPITSEELDVLNKIKALIQENKVYSKENETLKSNLLRIKSALEELLMSIA